MADLQIQFFNFIYRTLLSHSMDPNLPTPKSALLRTVDKTRFRDLFFGMGQVAGQLPVPDT